MNDRAFRIISAQLGKEISRLLEEASGHVILIAPFIKKDALGKLLNHIELTVSVTIVTRWLPDEVAAGVSDTSILDFAEERGNFRILVNRWVHAKVYVIDDLVSIIGSANLTNSALGFSTPSNIEVVACVEPVSTSLLVAIRQITKSSIPATNALRNAIEAAAESLRIPKPMAVDRELPALYQEPYITIFPALRVPERLFKGYTDVASFNNPEEREALLDDLAVLAIPDGLNSEEFKKEVGRRLLIHHDISEFDHFVLKPRRFGELTDWYKQRLPNLFINHKATQRHIQTLLRWMLFFLPKRYRLAEPHYSEIFGRTEGFIV